MRDRMTAAPLRYAREELLRSHPYARPHRVAGRRLHGGFDAEGRYLPPRTLVRAPAVAAWTAALRAQGGDLLAADASLLAGVRSPSVAQQKLLLQAGLGQTFWNQLTITGKIEARGRLLGEIAFPDLQGFVLEDVSEMAVGHLNCGLLEAHGLDEGGSLDVGGHDVMWFALRDLAFGPVDFPDAEVPARLTREEPTRHFPAIPGALEGTLEFLANLLLIEFRAEIGFCFAERLLRDPELFPERRAEALEAAEIVGRIRRDEEIHVASLRLYLGELRQLQLRTRDGGRLPGAAVIDPIWKTLVEWATVEQPRLLAAQQREMVRERVLRHRDGERIWSAFEALAD
jgi:hypothetical protein